MLCGGMVNAACERFAGAGGKRDSSHAVIHKLRETRIYRRLLAECAREKNALFLSLSGE